MTNLVKPLSTMTRILLMFIGLSFFTLQTYAETETQTGESDRPKVRVLTSEGAIELQLRPDVAPKTVENFLTYARDDFYEGTVFHRVISGFMIQGGGFTRDIKRKETRTPIRNEASTTLPNARGTVAMARTSSPDSATSQFFINVTDNDFLNAGVRGAGYTVFAKVTAGMNVVDSIASAKTAHSHGMADVPVEPIVIESVTPLE